MMCSVLFPGSFDPITNGHILVIKKALCVFDSVVIAVGVDNFKQNMFSIEERIDMIKSSIVEFGDKVSVDFFSGLVVSYMKEKNLNVIIKGIRDGTDFSYEMKMSEVNSTLNNKISTIMIPTSSVFMYVSSTLVKKIAKMGGDVSSFVPEIVNKKIKNYTKKTGSGFEGYVV